MLIWYDLVWNNNLGYVRLNGSYNILKSINFQVAGIPSLCKEKNMNMKSMSYTGKVLWTVWELDVEDYEILFFYINWTGLNVLCANGLTFRTSFSAKNWRKSQNYEKITKNVDDTFSKREF